MANTTSNDNEADAERKPSLPDASGQAAILLVESLIHSLIERSVITVKDAVGMIGVAAEVAEAYAAEPCDQSADLRSPLTILHSIGASLSFDSSN